MSFSKIFYKIAVSNFCQNKFHSFMCKMLIVFMYICQAWQEYIDRQPVRFFDREMLPHLVYITRRMAQFVGMFDLGVLTMWPSEVCCILNFVSMHENKRYLILGCTIEFEEFYNNVMLYPIHYLDSCTTMYITCS
jgi:hypothetical protein